MASVPRYSFFILALLKNTLAKGSLFHALLTELGKPYHAVVLCPKVVTAAASREPDLVEGKVIRVGYV